MKNNNQNAATPPTARLNRNERWWARIRQVREVAEELGRMPRLSDGCEPALISWIKNQRRATDLDDDREAALEQLSGWSWAPHDDQWDDRVDDLGRFIARTHRHPRVRAPHTDERALAHWFTRQRHAMASDDLAQFRLEQLRRILALPTENTYRCRNPRE